MEVLFCLILGYIFGSFQSASLFVRRFRNKDIRSVGSRNPGVANTFVNVSKELGVLVLFCDMMKVIIPSLICVLSVKKIDTPYAISMVCLGAAIGHNFPVFKKFKGGKGVAVAIIFTLLIDFRIFIVALLSAALFSYFLKSLTYGSLTFALMISVCAISFGHTLPVIISSVFQSSMIIILHIVRGRIPLKRMIKLSR